LWPFGDGYDISASLLDAMHFGQFIETTDNLDGQFSVDWIGYIFLLYCRINADYGSTSQSTMECNTHPKDALKNHVKRAHRL